MSSDQHILITGVCGFTGRHLVSHLCRESTATIIGVDTLAEPNVAIDRYCRCDLTDSSAVEQVVAAARPTTVFHLAGLMGSAPSDEIVRVNLGGFVCLANALRSHAEKSGRSIRMLAVGSAAELGTVGASKLPVGEDAPCEPESPYGLSKWEMTRRARAEPVGSPLQIVIARPFNLVGPGLSTQLALGHFARQIASATRGERKTVHCGPLDTRRDFVDVRDAVRGYVALAQHGRVGHLYNVCSGRSYRLGRLLEILITLANVKIRVASDTKVPRPGDLKNIYGDHAKITREIGWQPTITIERSLADLLAAA